MPLHEREKVFYKKVLCKNTQAAQCVCGKYSPYSLIFQSEAATAL